MINSIAVYCGANQGSEPIYADQAQALVRVLSESNITLINGGGSVGLMGVMADEMLKRNGKVIGVIPSFMMPWEVGHTGITELIQVEDMHARKLKMMDLSDGFVALPGGMGTLEELFEVLCWAQLKLHTKPIGILNTAGFFNPLLQMLDQMVERGFLNSNNRSLLICEEDPEALIGTMQEYKPIVETKWVK